VHSSTSKVLASDRTCRGRGSVKGAQQPKSELLTFNEVCDRLRMSAKTLRNHVGQGHLTYNLKGAGLKRKHPLFHPRSSLPGASAQGRGCHEGIVLFAAEQELHEKGVLAGLLREVTWQELVNASKTCAA